MWQQGKQRIPRSSVDLIIYAVKDTHCDLLVLFQTDTLIVLVLIFDLFVWNCQPSRLRRPHICSYLWSICYDVKVA